MLAQCTVLLIVILKNINYNNFIFSDEMGAELPGYGICPWELGAKFLGGKKKKPRKILDFWENRWISSGADEIRTRDLLNAIQTRYQLRHSPVVLVT